MREIRTMDELLHNFFKIVRQFGDLMFRQISKWSIMEIIVNSFKLRNSSLRPVPVPPAGTLSSVFGSVARCCLNLKVLKNLYFMILQSCSSKLSVFWSERSGSWVSEAGHVWVKRVRSECLWEPESCVNTAAGFVVPSKLSLLLLDSCRMYILHLEHFGLNVSLRQLKQCFSKGFLCFPWSFLAEFIYLRQTHVTRCSGRLWGFVCVFTVKSLLTLNLYNWHCNLATVTEKNTV